MPFVPLDSLELATVSRVRSARSTTCSMCNVCISKVLLRPSSLHFQWLDSSFCKPELKKTHADRVGRTYTNQADCEYRGWGCVLVSICQRTYVAARKFADYEGRAATPTKESSFRPEATHFAAIVEIAHRKSLNISNLPKQKRRESIPELQSKGKASDLPSLASQVKRE